MASDEATIRHMLGLLDRLSSKTLDYAVLQFKDHRQRFHESLSELKILKIPTGEGIPYDFAHLPLSNAPAHLLSQSDQAKCTPLNLPLKTVVQEGIETHGTRQHTLQSQVKCTPVKPPLTVVQEDIENYSSKQFTLQSQVKCTTSKPPLNSTVVQEGIENYGSKKYALRSRAPRKVIAPNASQRTTRSRAKQPVAAGTAATCNNSIKTEFTVLQDDAATGRSKEDIEFQQHQQVSREVSVLQDDGDEVRNKPGIELQQRQQVSREFTDLGGDVVNVRNKLDIEPQQHQQVSTEFTVLEDDVEVRNKSIIEPQQQQQASTEFTVLQCDVVKASKKIDINPQEHQHASSPGGLCLTTEDYHDMDIAAHSVSRKRKLSVNGVPPNAQHTANKRISPSYNSPLYEAFIIDEIMGQSLWGAAANKLSVRDETRTTFLERLNTPKNKDCAELEEGSDKSNGLAKKKLTGCMASDVPGENSQGHSEVAGSSSFVQKSNSKGMECILSDIPDENPAPPEPGEVIIDEAFPSCEQVEGSKVPTQEVEPHCEDEFKVLEHTSSFVSEFEHMEGVNSPVHTAPRLQVEQEDVSSLPNKEISLVNPVEGERSYVDEHKEEKLTFYSKSDDSKLGFQPEDYANQLNACEELGSLVLDAHTTQGTSSCSSPVRLQLEQNGKDFSFQSGSPQATLQAVALTSCELEKGLLTPNLDLTHHSPEAALQAVASTSRELGGELLIPNFNSTPHSPQAALQAAARLSCELAGGSLLPNLNLTHHSTEAQVLALENLSMQPSLNIQNTSPILSLKDEEASGTTMAGSAPQVKETENGSCGWEVKLKKPCSQIIEIKTPWIPELCQNNISKSESVSRLPSAVKNGLSIETPKFIPDVETEGTDDGPDNGDAISDTESQMDCSESPRPCHSMKEDDANGGKFRQNQSPNAWRVTPTGDDGFLKFSELLAQGTVNSSRRKRARSPTICTEESCKGLKRMKLLSSGKGGQLKERGELPHALYSQSPTFDRSNSSTYGFPHFSPVRKFQDTFGTTFGDSSSKSFDKGDFLSLQRQIMGSGKLSKSYSRLPVLRKDYLDTPRVMSLKAGLVDRASIKSSKQKPDCHLITHLEEDGKENQSPQTLNRDSNASVLSDWQVLTDKRKVLGHTNHSLGAMESPHKRYNLAVGTGSFLDLLQQKQLPLPHLNGKREVRVKALEAAELARKQEEQREIERRKRKLDCIGSKGEIEVATDKLQRGVTDKVKRVAELKIKMDQEKARKQEVEQRKKEEERKKKEAELADKKRKREDADKRDREEKRKRVEEVQRLRKEQEERQRVELNEKELKRKMLEERERERKAQEEEAKRQRRLEKEKEAERRRKQDQHLKATRFAEKQAERKRKEAMLLQARGNEDDELVAQIPLHNELSFFSTESFAVSNSHDLERQSKGILGTNRQASGDNWGTLRVPSVGTSAYCQNNSEKLTSLFENGPFLSTKQAISGPGINCEPIKSISYTTPANMRADVYASSQLIAPENEIESYEISPYKSSSDDEDDDQPKKPVPLWARKENLLQQLLWQQPVNPDRIFSSAKTCSLSEIFGTTGSRRCKDFTKRSASGDWLDDHATWKEELEYKNAMGYM